MSDTFSGDGLFPKGTLNEAYAAYFTGTSYLEMLSTEGLYIANGTFAPGMRTWRDIPLLVAPVLASGFAATTEAGAMNKETTLDARQRSIVAIAAFTASGDIDRLEPALGRGLDAGLTLNEVKEIPVQMYACAGFPRNLNGLGSSWARLCASA